MNHFIIKGILLAVGFLFVLSSAVSGQGAGESNVVGLSSKGPLEMSDLRVNSGEIGLYEKFEITFGLKGEWDNPFDPDQIKVDARFYSPDGEELVVPGFFYQEYHKEELGSLESPIFIPSGTTNGDLKKVGDPVWKVRFSPMMTGEYTYQVIVNNEREQITTPAQTFSSIPYNANHGFLKIPTAVGTNPLYFEYSDGTPFFGVAMGRQQGNTYPSERTYNRFANAGGNFNRLFLTNGPLNLGEMLPGTPRPDRGVGKMNLEGSWHLDQVLEAGEKLGIYHMLTLTNQWTFNHRWEVHAYNKENGGVLDSRQDYWTNEEAMQYFERHLRYVVARWGYSTSVFSWDLWNEYSAAPGSDLEVAIPWHRRMARYISSIDVFGHVIHTNDGSLNGRDDMHALPEIEMITTNIYRVRNMAKVAEDWTKYHTGQFGKPYVLTEFGTGHGVGAAGGYAGMDPERRMVHNALWSPIMSGGASTGMAWEGNWLDHEIFYTYTRAVAAFVEGIPFSKRQWISVDVASFTFPVPQPSNPVYGDVIIDGWSGNFRRSPDAPEFFQIDENGNVDRQESLSAVLTGSDGRGRRRVSSVAFRVKYPENVREGEFVVYISEIGSTEPTPQLTVTVDGDEVLKEDLLPLEVDGYHPRMHNQYYTIPVSGGEHTIRVENSGGGSFITSFELKNYIQREGPDLEVRGLQSEDYILLWLKNQKFTLLHELMNIDWEPQPEGILELQNVPDGRWIAEWINTIDTASVKTEVIESTNQRLELSTQVIGESIAVRLHKISGE